MIGRDAEKAFFAPFFLRKAHVPRSRVFSGENGGKGHAQLAAGLHDANGDFTPVGYQNLMLLQGDGFLSFVQACLRMQRRRGANSCCLFIPGGRKDGQPEIGVESAC